MERESTELTIRDLRGMFLDIEFPEYQREPNIWSRDQKQRLIDSILRRFDIASIYFYRRDDDTLECIDGRQRLNAIMSFVGENSADQRDNGFALRVENEISSGLATEFDGFHGHTFEEIDHHAGNHASALCELAQAALEAVLDCPITTVYLSGTIDEEEFNLQFLRLNLGTLVNAGEKLHAMVGWMRDVVFAKGGIGMHPFFECVRIPTRRYAKELTAAQVLLQLFSLSDVKDFGRARHFELQRFLKRHEESTQTAQSLVEEGRVTLDAMNDGVGGAAHYLRNRAVTVSLVLLAWRRNVGRGGLQANGFWSFARVFLGRLAWQVENMKAFNVVREYPHLVEFQRHLTQAAVERTAVARRHEILRTSLDQFLDDGTVEGDRKYQDRTGNTPGVR